jgi:DUF971 family protein
VTTAAQPWPTELRLKRSTQVLDVTFDDGVRFSLSAEYLRVMTPSAVDRGHGAGPGRTVDGKAGVGIRDLRPIGRYAVRIDFDDGHDTGLYSWAMLHELGRDQKAKWADYLARMKREGLSR